MAGDTPDYEKLRREDAKRVHDGLRAYVERGNEGVIAAGNAAIRSLFLMHGGALVAMLTFISNVISKDDPILQVQDILGPMVWFAYGLALAVAASSGTYLANFSYVSGAQETVRTWEHPFRQETSKSKRWIFWGRVFHIATVLCALCSLCLFVYGFSEMKYALSPSPTKPGVTGDEAFGATALQERNSVSTSKATTDTPAVKPEVNSSD